MQNMMLEFEDAQAGFRLQRLEVLNWGTFNGRIWAIEPHGQTALLTGANGSGKSTLVDALLTLLVPYGKRAYNQASGAERRRERDERTYMLGAYGKVRGDDGIEARTQFLRTKDDYAVLLGVFVNQAFQQTLTLAQLFWLDEGALRKFFVLAEQPLSIRQHFGAFGTPNELKKRLRAAGAEVYDEFSRYSRQFCKLVGLRSEQALDLFSQTVSIKEIGGLNDFVRGHMLERTNPQEQIDQLVANYKNLTDAHQAILKAEQQLAQLRPLAAEAEQHEAQAQKIRELKHADDAVPAFFAQRKLALLEQASATATTLLHQASERRNLADTVLRELREREVDLRTALNQDELGQQLRNLEKTIDYHGERMRDKQPRERRYSELARKLNRPPYSDEPSFASSVQACRDALKPLGEKLSGLEQQRVELEITFSEQRKQRATLEAELASLRERKSQIPANNLQVRAGLLAALGLQADDVPFVGELLKVRANELAWEGALERLLHGFGLQLLVAEADYQRVSAYVNSTDLRGRLVFQRVRERRAAPPAARLDPDALPHKLEIKPGSAFGEWLRAELCESYNYICCDELERFRREHRALTRAGLSKSGLARHEKDDRRRIDDRKFYILGWDNRDKIAAYEAELQRLKQTIDQINGQLGAVKREKESYETKRTWLHELLTFESFAALDWRSDERQIGLLRAEQQRLEQSSNHLQQLRHELEQLQAQLQQAQVERDRAAGEATNRQRDLDDYTRQRAEAETRLSLFPLDEVERAAPLVAARVKQKPLTLENLRDSEEETRKSFQGALNTEQGRLNGLSHNLIRRMNDYKRSYPADTSDVDAAIEALGEFRQMLQTIEHDDLPRHARRFKEMLDEKVIVSVDAFRNALEAREEGYREVIDNLNGSLRQIDYTPTTYIALHCEGNKDRRIVEFKALLRDCLPDVGAEATPAANEASFQQIRSLIERLDSEEHRAWASYVTDVRNWLNFAAYERYKEDHAQKSYYSDSSGKSGGQKAKLAYTILASAIAYQYGLDAATTRARSFRFVVVDEAFSKSDEHNARYAMELFKQLHLQLLVVTPLDKTHIVEPYIAACHFVANSAEENDSRVYNLTLGQYYEQKLALSAQASAVEAFAARPQGSEQL